MSTPSDWLDVDLDILNKIKALCIETLEDLRTKYTAQKDHLGPLAVLLGLTGE